MSFLLEILNNLYSIGWYISINTSVWAWNGLCFTYIQKITLFLRLELYFIKKTPFCCPSPCFIDLLHRWLLRDGSLWQCSEALMSSSLEFSRIRELRSSSLPGSYEGHGKTVWQRQTRRSHGGFSTFPCWRRQQRIGPNFAAEEREWRGVGCLRDPKHGAQHGPGENPGVLSDVWHWEQGLHHSSWHAGELLK